MPKSSLTMEEGTILKWYKNEGEEIKKGEPLVQIMEEKSTIDLEATSSGIVKKLYYKEQEDVSVGKIIAVIGLPDEEIPTVEEESTKEEQVISASTLEVTKPTIVTGIVKASPLAKKIAKEQGIDLSLIKGTGPGGRITETDVNNFKRKKEVPSDTEKKVKDTIPLTGFRKIIADRMNLSAKTHPRITIFMDIDFTEVKKFRERMKILEKLEVSYTSIIVKAVAKALSQHSIINSSIEGNEIKIFEDINIGVAVATDVGLVVPVIHQANKKTLIQIDKEAKELVDKTRKNIIEKEYLSHGTFTITNLGMFDVDTFTPLINSPECAILGVGKLEDKVAIYENQVMPRFTSTFSLSFDHRIIDGVPAARFLQTVKTILERTELK